jgi:hypothetical protein
MNWPLFRRKVKVAVIGLTHRRCCQCGGPKGLSLRANCEECQFYNLMRICNEKELS